MAKHPYLGERKTATCLYTAPRRRASATAWRIDGERHGDIGRRRFGVAPLNSGGNSGGDVNAASRAPGQRQPFARWHRSAARVVNDAAVSD